MPKLEVAIYRDAMLRATRIEIPKKKLSVDIEDSDALRKITFNAHRLPDLAHILDIIYPREHIISIRGNQWYDRNPKGKSGAWTSTNVPHALTERLSYKCPVDKIAMVEVLSAIAQRHGAATTADTVKGIWEYTTNSTSSYILVSKLPLSNNVGDNANNQIGTTLTLFQGDYLKAYSQDISTGGSVFYHLAYKLTEFDA